MIIAYSALILCIVVLHFLTLKYKKTLKDKLEKEKHPLIRIYGLAMFITDRLPNKIVNKNRFINKAVKELRVKEDTKREVYLYVVSKVAVCVVVVLLTMIIGVGSEVYTLFNRNNEVKELKRNTSTTVTYDIFARSDDGEEHSLTIDVKKRELKEKEILKKIKQNQNKLLKKVLDKNESAEYVTKPLNLVSHLGDGILVHWNIDDSKSVGYDGQLSDNIPREGRLVELTATMTYKKVAVDYSFHINVYPKTTYMNMENQVQSYINKADEYSDSVQLPETIDGKQLTYFNEKPQNSLIAVGLGFIISVALFFLKDKDLRSELEERNRQLSIDYPEIVSKLLLYHSAGLSIKSAIEKIVGGYKEDKKNLSKVSRYAYEELEVALIKMKSGISEIVAISEYGKRCGLHCYIKLSGLIEQNIRRGTNALTIVLKNELESSMFEKKNIMLKRGGQISTKLMGPMIIMLVISIAVIMAPAFLSMKF